MKSTTPEPEEVFDRAYGQVTASRESVDHSHLRPLLSQVFVEATAIPTSRARLKTALLKLVQFLSSPPGRTSDHFQAVDWFFCLADDLWLPSDIHLPQDLKDVFAEFFFLHGALEQPEHHTTPEQLLQIVEAIED